MAIDTPARIAILGAGPIGLEAALYGRYLGYDVDLYERGRVCEHVRQWGQVRMFTRFGANRSPLGLAALQAQSPDWRPPADDQVLTGLETAAAYWIPLAQSDLLADGLHEHTEVVAVGRQGLRKQDLVDNETRGDGLFRILLRDARKPHAERIATADIVIDTTGVYGSHDWLGDGGVPAIGELAAAPQIEYGIPDVLGHDRSHYAGRSILVVGSGYSAATSVVALGQLARECADTWITWITRPGLNAESEPVPRIPPISVIVNDPLAERDRVARRANALAAEENNHVTYWPATLIEAISWHADPLRFEVRTSGQHAGELEVDRVIANVGSHADVSLFRELQFEACPFTGAPARLATALRNQGGGDAHAFGPETLVNPEPHFYVLGAKSYGRNRNFTLAVGLEQIRALFSLIGDRASLNLYATVATASS